MMASLADIALALKRAERVLICGHVMPDGDCLGSVLALGLAMERLGKMVTMAGPDPVPEIFDFLPGVERFLVGKPPPDEYDTLIVLDCPARERLGRCYCDMVDKDLVIINIDHHTGTKLFGTYTYIDPQAAAVGEILFDLLKLMEIKIDLDIAVCLYTAIFTDTGSFKYDNVKPDTHRRAAKLLEAGVSPAQINIKVHEEKPVEAVLLIGAAINTLSVSPCGRVSWMIVTRDILHSTGAEDEHTEGLVNYARSLKGAEVGLLFHELKNGEYKISFRSKDYVNVNELAALFGGGGHQRAAGCVMNGELDKVKEKIITAAVLASRGSLE
ncbi:MAG: Exopolyphosphatase-related protein [Pelotomaculum thermopropionicum]|uniref:Exopolyphosphatase-related protein n=1 Tax=Pelotomaculum thermopropionicum TaxID=110500 RepID=A0A124FZE9_9FIRM|nr:MAG: Exopolyphosphatase-related protein [Pelotomaculum thermopropionicum]